MATNLDEQFFEKFKIFLQSIVNELDMRCETSLTNILKAYFDKNNERTFEILKKQIEQKGAVNRILVIGQTGVGKSSLINLFTNKEHMMHLESVRGNSIKRFGKKCSR